MARIDDVQERIDAKARRLATKDWVAHVKTINDSLGAMTDCMDRTARIAFVQLLRDSLEGGLSRVYLNSDIEKSPHPVFVADYRATASAEFIAKIERLEKEVNDLYDEVGSMQQ